MLTGQAKKHYQRNYMRRRRAKAKGLTERLRSSIAVRPDERLGVRPVKQVDMDKLNEGRQFKYYKYNPFTGVLTKERQTSRKGFNE